MRIADAYRIRKKRMNESVLPLVLIGGFFAAWFVLQKWVLPAMGVAT